VEQSPRTGESDAGKNDHKAKSQVADVKLAKCNTTSMIEGGDDQEEKEQEGSSGDDGPKDQSILHHSSTSNTNGLFIGVILSVQIDALMKNVSMTLLVP
jgi:hypothetical protein